jgi:prevent-host-death family protein
MKIASVAEIKSQFSAFLKASEEGPVIVTRNGRPTAVLLAVKDEEDLDRLVLAYTPHFRTILEAARRQIREGLGIRHDDFWNDLEPDLDDILPSDEAKTCESHPVDPVGLRDAAGPINQTLTPIGNGLGLVLDPLILDQLRIDGTTQLEVTIEENGIVIRPIEDQVQARFVETVLRTRDIHQETAEAEADQ